MSPFLVIESGATKLSWQLATANKRLANGQQDGLHPQLVGSAQWQIQLLDLARTLPIAPKRIFYYGTGCMSTQGRHQVTAYFKKFWQPPYELTVETDLLGACRAVCQQSEGLVAILGTGSNTAVYKNERIVQQRGGLGYVLGDEGSGAHLGKNLLKAFLQNELPEPLAHALHQRYHLDRGAVIEALYRGAAPSRFLAQFGPLLNEYRELPFVQFLLKKSFRALCLYYLVPLSETYGLYEVNCIGAIALHFQTELKDALHQQGLALGRVLKLPLDELCRWHQERG